MSIQAAQRSEIESLRDHLDKAGALVEALLEQYEVWKDSCPDDEKIIAAARRIFGHRRWKECDHCGDTYPEIMGRVVRTEAATWDCPGDVQWVCNKCLDHD